MNYNLWFQELSTKGIGQQLAVKDTLYTGKTKYQEVRILDTFPFGRCLILNGRLQSAEVDEFIYHEALVHPVMLSHPEPKSVFIAGGGEGATLREVLAYKSVERVVMVDIDEEVIKLCKTFLPSWHQGAFSDPRARVIFAEARRYLSQSPENYDVLILDLTDPIEGGQSYLLYTKEFYELIKKRLQPDGLIVTQAGPCRLPSLETFANLCRTLREVFKMVLPYQAEVPSFGGGWGFILAGDKVGILSKEEIDHRISERLNKKLSFYDGTTHQAMFSFPKYLKELIRGGRVITDKLPQFVD